MTHISPLLDPPTMTDHSLPCSVSPNWQTSADSTPVAHPTVLCSVQFLNVNISTIQKATPLPHVL